MPSSAEKFAVNSKRRRTMLRLSQQQLADRASCSISFVSSVESGRRAPRLDTLDAFAKALRTSPAALIS